MAILDGHRNDSASSSIKRRDIFSTLFVHFEKNIGVHPPKYDIGGHIFTTRRHKDKRAEQKVKTM